LGTGLAYSSAGEIGAWSKCVTGKEEQTEIAANEPDAKKAEQSGILKYIIIGGGAFLLVITIALAAMLFLGGGGHEETASETAAVERPAEGDRETESAVHEAAPGENDDPPPFYGEEESPDQPDPSVVNNIMENLAYLDYQPQESETIAEDESIRMSVEDSIVSDNWLEAEKAALAAKEKELEARERELVILDKKVSQKLLTLEQAETARISNLAKLYDGMDPRAVAQLMANLDDETVVALIPRMKTKNASSVLALLPPQRAAKLSKQMITIAEN